MIPPNNYTIRTETAEKGSGNAMTPEPTPKQADPAGTAPQVRPEAGTPTQPLSPPELQKTVCASASGKPGSPTLPGYEIEEEVGRGGMGVVYRARQKSLNRLVALKVIRDSALAGPEHLARFRAEAEAVARLQHPNIVQVHELYEKEGQPFFAMEYVSGGSLAQYLGGKPKPPREAAELIEKLARAVHYAHQQGIIHRDLKPANVLLTPEGDPKISDFGLVKRIDINDGMTPSSAVLGTPSYMAPEQAAGNTQDIGPTTDIYALGAILYETLTGRPPFEADTLLKTLDQVRFQEPVPPTQTYPEVPAALECICLRCLQKEPARRYPSAAALAEDLQAFLEGKEIAVNPSEGTHDAVHVPGYEVGDELARGGVWIVHKARDLRGKRPVALKRVRPGSPLTPEHLIRLRTASEEARKLEHPNIARLHDVGGMGARLFLALELVEGGTLARKMAGQPLPPAEAARLVAILAGAIQHAHERGLLHCHLQMANVLLAHPADAQGLSVLETRIGVPKLIGFEMGRRRSDAEEATELDTIRPTSYAMSPEQLFNKPDQIGPATDVYALGVLLYELLTGRPPYQATTTSDLLLKVGFEILPRPRNLNRDVPAWLDRICWACLEKEPSERYSSATDLAEDLGRFLKGERPSVVPPSWWERFRGWVQKRLGH
jgi:serine/threonine protein kinase